MSWQQGAAAPCAVRVVGRVRASGTQATSRPRRQPRPSPSAPAKKERQASACLSFFVVTGGEASARGACRASPPKRRLWRMQRGGDGAAVGDWQGGPPPQTEPGTARGLAKQVQVRPSIFAMPWWRLPPPPDFYQVFSPAHIRLQPLLPLQHPERTRFRPFWAFPGAFFSFSPFLGRKIPGSVFVHPAA